MTTPVPLGAPVTPLERLNAALPANPANDSLVEAAAREVVEALREAEAIIGTVVEDGPDIDSEYGDCRLCDDPGVEKPSDDPSAHNASCTWRIACEYAARHGLQVTQ